MGENANRGQYNKVHAYPNMFRNEMLIAAQNKQKYRLFNNSNANRVKVQPRQQSNNIVKTLSRSVDDSLHSKKKNMKYDHVMALRQNFTSNKKGIRSNSYQRDKYDN